MKRHLLLALFALCLPLGAAQGQDKPAAKKGDPDRATLEKQFQAALSGATLVGHFTAHGKKTDTADLKEERYTITGVTKIKDDWWLIKARVKYGTRDITAPIPVQVKWAGDTPIITLTDMAIPLLGKYTARVIIYRGKYAGTWSGGDHGGHLFGRIEKEKKKQSK